MSEWLAGTELGSDAWCGWVVVPSMAEWTAVGGDALGGLVEACGWMAVGGLVDSIVDWIGSLPWRWCPPQA